MSLFQVSVGSFTLLGFLWCARRCVRGPGRYVRMVNGLLALVWVSGCVLVIKPELTSVVARVFGIGRGVDLVLYLFMMLAFIYAIVMYYRLCDIRRDITLIVRHIAIREHLVPAEKERIESKESDALHKGHSRVRKRCAESEHDNQDDLRFHAENQ